MQLVRRKGAGSLVDEPRSSSRNEKLSARTNGVTTEIFHEAMRYQVDYLTFSTEVEPGLRLYCAITKPGSKVPECAIAHESTALGHHFFIARPGGQLG